MSLKLTAALLLLTANLPAQPTPSDRYKYNPLLTAGKLWNLIRYAHPRLSGESTAWDTALVDAIPKIEGAHSDEELALALDNMLKTLNDPCTRIVHGVPGKSVSTQAPDADTIVIRAGDGDLAASFGASLLLRSGLAHAKTIIWDLRGSRMLPGQGRPSLLQLADSGIGYAYRQHFGYPQEGAMNAGYYSALQIVDPRRASAKPPEANVNQVYLIDKDSAVPAQAIIDQVSNHTAIMSEDPPQAMQAGFTELVPVYGTIQAEVRVAEYRYADGTTEFAPNRVVLNRGNEAVTATARIASGGEGYIPGDRPKFQIFPAGFHDAGTSDPYPSREWRILAAIRTWGIFHYFDPCVTAMAGKWDDVLIEFLPQVAAARNASEFHMAIAGMVARTGDPLATAASDELFKFYGQAAPAFEVRFIENQPVITQLFGKVSAETQPTGPRIGDVILSIDGTPVANRIAELSSHLAAPWREALMSKVAARLLDRPADGTMRLKVRRADGSEPELTVPVERTALNYQLAHRTGDAVRLINEKLGYVDLERVAANGVDEVFAKLVHTSAMILDLRGYAQNRVGSYSIAPQLGDRDAPLAAQILENVVGIGFDAHDHITVQQSELRLPKNTKPRYHGKTVALVDDSIIGYSEDCALFLKAANDTVIIGAKPVGGFIGSMTLFQLPGGIRIGFSGQAVRWPDGRLLYPDGIQPDIAVSPTLAGIRAGKDEVLERAIEYLSKGN